MIEDSELLRRYADEASEASFTTLVQRHINVVHAVALRRSNGDSHLAADVTQKIFISVARNAKKLASHRSLSAWLYTSTRNAVLDALRHNRRRIRREEEAMSGLDTENSRGELPDELILDEVGNLNELEREAILLRFFQGWQFARIGEALRMSESAARMRVDRALGKLRASLERRGVTSSAAALVAALADNTGLGASAGLTLQVTRAALAAGPASSMGLAGFASLVSSAKSTLSLTAIAVLVLGGVALYQDRRIHQLNGLLYRVVVEHTPLAPKIRPARGSAPQSSAAPAPNAPFAALTVQDQIALLKAQLDANPEKKIPEIELLSAKSWELAANAMKSTDNAALSTVFRILRNYGRTRFAGLSMAALNKFAAANGGILPGKVSDLAPFFDEKMPDEILDRYVMLRSGNFDDMPLSLPLVGEISGVTDDFGDTVINFGRGPQSVQLLNGDAFTVRLQRAVNAYASSHDFKMPTDAADMNMGFSPAEMPRVQAQLDIMASRARPGATASVK